MDNIGNVATHPDLSGYEVHSRLQIIALLSAARDQRQLLNMSISAGKASDVTVILAINKDGGHVILDWPNDRHWSDHMVPGKTLRLDGVLDHIKIHFSVPVIGHCLYQGRPALQVSLPMSLIRIQRRDFYRINTAIIHPILCSIALPGLSPADPALFPLKNISAGGMMVTDHQQNLDTRIGTLYPSCRLMLPGTESMSTAVQVRNSHPFMLPNGHLATRIGFQFIALPSKSMQALQRYINKLEYEMKAMQPG